MSGSVSLLKGEGSTSGDMFQEVENLYGKAMQRIWQGAEATRRQYFGLIIMMMSLHLRSPAYQNLSGLDNLELYRGLEESFMTQVLMADFPDAQSPQDRWANFSAIWRVTVMKTPDEIFTSDNPALCCAIDRLRDVHFILLPVTPSFCAVAFDKRFLRIVGPITSEDLLKMQTLLAGASLDALYSSRAFAREERDILNNFRANRTPFKRSVDGTHWTPNFLILKEGFSFFRKIEH